MRSDASQVVYFVYDLVTYRAQSLDMYDHELIYIESYCATSIEFGLICGSTELQ